MTTTICAGCGKSGKRTLWIYVAGTMWHPDCFNRQDLERRRELLNRPIKERHDGPNTRDSGRRSKTG